MGTAHPGAVGGGSRGASLAGGRLVLAGGYNQTLRRATAQTWLGTLAARDPTLIQWEALPDNLAGAFSRMGASASPLPAQSGQIFFAGGDPTGHGLAVLDRTYILDVNTRKWQLGPPKPTGVSNLVNLVPIRWQRHVYLAAVGGYDGQNPIAANEWLLLGSQSQPLPVEVISFQATLQHDRACLQWQTAMEQHNAGFVIEASADGHVFTQVATVGAQLPATSSIRSYSWREQAPSLTAYYRLWQQDVNGERQLVGTRVLQRTVLPFALHVFPNPMAEASHLQLTGIASNESFLLTLFDNQGRVVLQQNHIFNSVPIPFRPPTNLPPGMYWLRCQADTKVTQVRFVKTAVGY